MFTAQIARIYNYCLPSSSDMAADQVLKSESTDICCAEWKKKCGKLQESRNALRQAVKVLEQKLNEIEAENVNLKKGVDYKTVEMPDKVREIITVEQKFSSGQDGKDDKKDLQACISERENEINELKELLEKEKIRADSLRKNAEKEKKKAVEAWKLLEAEKNKIHEREIQIDKIEADKSQAHRVQLGSLEKEAKLKLASEMSKFKEATKRFEAEKRKLLAEKKHTESEMAKAQEKLEVEKQKATREKRRADAEMVKVEEQKKLAEDNWKKAIEEKQLADQKSQQLEETKQTIEYLKQKMHELSSSRKTVKMSGFSSDINVNGESTKVKLLESRLKLEKLRTKRMRENVKLEANQRKFLQQELGHLKLVLVQVFHRLDMLDASFSPVAGSIDDPTKSGDALNMQKSNAMRKLCSLEPSHMHSQWENEHPSPCCTTVDGHNSSRKAMQHMPLALSGGSYAESITGIDSKLEPLAGGSKRTKLQSSAINSSTALFSDGQLMGSQEGGAFPVIASAKLAQENLNARERMSNPSDKVPKSRYHENVTMCDNIIKGPLDIGGDREVKEHKRKRKRIPNTVEDFANLSSKHNKFCMQVEKGLSDLHSVLYRNVDTSFEKGGKMVPGLEDNLQGEDGRTPKKRKKAHRAKVDAVPGSNKNKKSAGQAKAEQGTDVCGHALHPACGERIYHATNDFDCIFSFVEASDGNYLRLLELEDAADEERYKRAMNAPLSPSIPEVELHDVEIFDTNNLKPFLEEALHEDLLSPIGNLLPSPRFDVINIEISSNERFDVSGYSFNSQGKSTQARKTEVANVSQVHSSARTGFIGSAHNQLHEIFVIFHNVADNDGISRVISATKNCIARCSLVTETEWTVSSILTALKMEEKLLQKEKIYVLLSLLLFNFTRTTSRKFGKLLDGNLIFCLNSYAEHMRSVMSDAETRILFLQNYLRELLSLTEEFLIGGGIIVINPIPPEALSQCDSKTNIFLDGVNLTLSSEVASNEQLVAGSILLASVCAAADYVGFLYEASYNILRLCKWDSFMVLTILHAFAYLGGEEYFSSGNYGLMMAVLKSLVIEGGNQSVATTSCLLEVNQLHSGSCSFGKCPFLDGAESVDNVALLLIEKIKNCLLQGVGSVQCANDMDCDMSCCLKKYMISTSQPDALDNVTMCHLSDVLSLVELVAHKMSWHWTDIKLVPPLLSMLGSCVVESFAIPVVVLLGQLGRLGVDVGGYEDRGVEQLRLHLSSYLCQDSSIKASLPLQIATATSLLGLLPLDLETFVQSNFSLQGYSTESVSGCAENLKKWFSGVGSDERDLLYNILKSANVYKK
ncbi:hypothetical protein L6164_033165 [Bauhinia variegata]|uniref:Uncharacterized protein n=1 Tax=Bauhinia variegata TaxID=167791 RepID=A0ACB9KQV5_BAUVA|nr:hypothetical protein L6164_033165 [Bauhinia variegata]